jgi:hypothetical protein
MVDRIFITGAQGQLGRQLVSSLTSAQVSIIPIKSAVVLSVETNTRLKAFLNEQFVSKISINSSRPSVALILAHRSRADDSLVMLRDELRMTRDLVYAFAELCREVRVVVLGSVTGRQVDQASSEAYHYAKDLQKSIVRRSILLPNLFMNLVELSWFVKHTTAADAEYVCALDQARGNSPTGEVVEPRHIADLCLRLLLVERSPRGQVFALDDGYSLMQ